MNHCLFSNKKQVSVESQDHSSIPNDQDESSCESATNPLHSWLCKFKKENGFDEENEVQKDTNLNWWPNTGIDKVSSSQEQYVDNQYLDVKEINHSDLNSCEWPVSIKTNKSEEEWM